MGQIRKLSSHFFSIVVYFLTNLFYSFAIRIDNVLGIINQLCSSQKVVRPWLGFRMVSLSPNVWQQLKDQGSTDFLPETQAGVLITSV